MSQDHDARRALVAQCVALNHRINRGFLAIEGMSLSHTQWRILSIVQVQQSCTQKHLSSALNTTHANTSQVLTRLQKMGYIQRQKKGAERWITLSAKAREVLTQHAQAYERLLDEILGPLSPQEQQIMSMWLARLNATTP